MAHRMKHAVYGNRTTGGKTPSNEDDSEKKKTLEHKNLMDVVIVDTEETEPIRIMNGQDHINWQTAGRNDMNYNVQLADNDDEDGKSNAIGTFTNKSLPKDSERLHPVVAEFLRASASSSNHKSNRFILPATIQMTPFQLTSSCTAPKESPAVNISLGGSAMGSNHKSNPIYLSAPIPPIRVPLNHISSATHSTAPSQQTLLPPSRHHLVHKEPPVVALDSLNQRLVYRLATPSQKPPMPIYHVNRPIVIQPRDASVLSRLKKPAYDVVHDPAATGSMKAIGSKSGTKVRFGKIAVVDPKASGSIQAAASAAPDQWLKRKSDLTTQSTAAKKSRSNAVLVHVNTTSVGRRHDSSRQAFGSQTGNGMSLHTMASQPECIEDDSRKRDAASNQSAIAITTLPNGIAEKYPLLTASIKNTNTMLAIRTKVKRQKAQIHTILPVSIESKDGNTIIKKKSPLRSKATLEAKAMIICHKCDCGFKKMQLFKDHSCLPSQQQNNDMEQFIGQKDKRRTMEIVNETRIPNQHPAICVIDSFGSIPNPVHSDSERGAGEELTDMVAEVKSESVIVDIDCSTRSKNDLKHTPAENSEQLQKTMEKDATHDISSDSQTLAKAGQSQKEGSNDASEGSAENVVQLSSFLADILKNHAPIVMNQLAKTRTLPADQQSAATNEQVLHSMNTAQSMVKKLAEESRTYEPKPPEDALVDNVRQQQLIELRPQTPETSADIGGNMDVVSTAFSTTATAQNSAADSCSPEYRVIVIAPTNFYEESDSAPRSDCCNENILNLLGNSPVAINAIEKSLKQQRNENSSLSIHTPANHQELVASPCFNVNYQQSQQYTKTANDILNKCSVCNVAFDRRTDLTNHIRQFPIGNCKRFQNNLCHVPLVKLPLNLFSRNSSYYLDRRGNIKVSHGQGFVQLEKMRILNSKADKFAHPYINGKRCNAITRSTRLGWGRTTTGYSLSYLKNFLYLCPGMLPSSSRRVFHTHCNMCEGTFKRPYPYWLHLDQCSRVQKVMKALAMKKTTAQENIEVVEDDEDN